MRWISQNPLGYDGGDANLYRYVGNSVTDTIDPGGLAAYWSDWFRNVTGPVGIGKYLLDYLAEYDKGKVLSATLDASTPHTLSANNIGRGDNGQIGGIAAAQAQGVINEFSADRAVDAASSSAAWLWRRRLRNSRQKLDSFITSRPTENWVSTVRGGPWSPRFAEVFERAGMTLKARENIVRLLGHSGPHSEAYHTYDFEDLEWRYDRAARESGSGCTDSRVE